MRLKPVLEQLFNPEKHHNTLTHTQPPFIVKVVTLWYRAPDVLMGSRKLQPQRMSTWGASGVVGTLGLTVPFHFEELQLVKGLKIGLGFPTCSIEL